MTPVILHLNTIFSEFPKPTEHLSRRWTFLDRITQCNTDFYNKILPLHPVLNIEYSVLRNQLKDGLASSHLTNRKKIIDQLTAALMLAELMEHIYQYYAPSPREIARFRKHQLVYRALLTQMKVYTFEPRHYEYLPVDDEFSVTTYIREITARINWLRLFITRSKRMLNFLVLVVNNSDSFNFIVQVLDQYTTPFFAYLAWCFFTPRLFTNLFLILKHLIPRDSMDEHEKSLSWMVRLLTQLQRRWFELANDIVWLTVGIINCFLLIGPLAPIAIYLALCAFAFDILNSGIRAYIELGRIYQLKKDYTELFNNTKNETIKNNIKEYEKFLNQRLEFEKLRAALHFTGTVATFLAMILAIPALAVSPIVPLIGAILLVLIVGVTYKLTMELENYRPVDTLEKASAIKQLGFFAKKNEPQKQVPNKEENAIPMEQLSTDVLCSQYTNS